MVSFLLPTGEEGRLSVSKYPEPCLVHISNGRDLWCSWLVVCYLRKVLIEGVVVVECTGLILRPTMSSCRESLLDLLPLDLLDLGMGRESFLLAGRW